MKRKRYMRNRSFTSHRPAGQKEEIINQIIRKAKKEIEDMAVSVTKEDFLEYKKVQESGMYNMFDPRAREMTSLSREQWVHIIQSYKSLNEAWGKDETSNEE